jgi:hypothetical protein
LVEVGTFPGQDTAHQLLLDESQQHK